MRRLMAIAVVLIAFTGTGPAMARVRSAASHWTASGCSKRFTVRMGERAGWAVWHARTVGLRQLRLLGYIERCQRNPRAWPVVRAYDHRQGGARRARDARRRRRVVERRLARSQSEALASWYEDGGSTACGFHAGYGVAHKTLACGTRVLVCYPYGSSRCVGATVDDRGPFVAGREWDLNQTVAAALGFDGVHDVGVRVG